MKNTLTIIRQLLDREDSLGLDDYIRILYEACESNPYCNDDDISEVRDRLETCLSDLEFRQQDRVLSTVNELSALYVYAGSPRASIGAQS